MLHVYITIYYADSEYKNKPEILVSSGYDDTGIYGNSFENQLESFIISMYTLQLSNNYYLLELECMIPVSAGRTI